MANKYSKREWEKQFGGILQKLELGGSLNRSSIASELKAELDARGMTIPKKFDLGGFLKKYQPGGGLDPSLAYEENTQLTPQQIFQAAQGPVGEPEPIDFVSKALEKESPIQIKSHPGKTNPLTAINKITPFAQAIGQVVNFGLEGLKKNTYEMGPMEKDYNPYTMELGGVLEKYAEGGDPGPRKRNILKPGMPGYTKPTTQDSLNVYNSQIRQLAKLKELGYTAPEYMIKGASAAIAIPGSDERIIQPGTGTRVKNPSIKEDEKFLVESLNKSRERFYNNENIISTYKQVDKNPNVLEKAMGLDWKETKYKRLGLNYFYNENPINPNQFTQREASFNQLNFEIPPVTYDDRIPPNTAYLYKNDQDSKIYKNDVVQLIGYDPISIKPYNMLTPAEKKLREQRYGAPANAETKPSAETPRKPKPKPKPKPNPIVQNEQMQDTIRQPIVQEKQKVPAYFQNVNGQRVPISKEDYEGIKSRKTIITKEMRGPQLDTTRYIPKFTDGGTLPGSKTFMGPTHEEGGIPVNENGEVNASTAIAEVENDEFMHKFSFIPRKGNYIFSKALGTADMAEKLVDKYTKKKGKHANPLTDNLSKQQMEFELKQIADLNDMRKAMEAQLRMAETQAEVGMQEQQMKLGGILGNIFKQYRKGGEMEVDPIRPKVDFVPVKLFDTPDFNINPPQEDFNMNQAILEGLGEKDISKGKYKNIIEDYGKLGVTYFDDKGNRLPKQKSTIKEGSVESDILKGLGKLQPYQEEEAPQEEKIPYKDLSKSDIADLMRSSVIIGDTLQALRPAEQESPILAEYAKARGELDSMTADLTASRNAATATFNEASEQIRNTSPSIQSYITRKMGMAASQAEAFSQIAMKEREMRNAIAQAKGGFEQAVAADIASRRYQNRVDNLQNKARKEAYLQRLGDNMMGVAKMLDEKHVAEMTTKEGLNLVKALGENFEAFTDDSGNLQGFRFKLKQNKPVEVKP